MSEENAPAPAVRLLSRRRFAALKGWAPSHVVDLARKGVLSIWLPCPSCLELCNARTQACTCGQAIAGVVDPRRGRIDPARAELELAAAADPAREYVADRWAAQRAPVPGAEFASPAGQGSLPLEPRSGSPGSEAATFAESKARHQHFQASLAELEYRRRIGELVEAEDVRSNAFRTARLVRDALFGIPDRLAPVLAGERDQVRVHELLLKEITAVCDNLSREIGKVGE